MHALVGVEREIRAQDPHNRRKYLREFAQAFTRYDSLLDKQEIQNALRAADVVLIGDYHALPAAQRYAASLMEQRALAGDRPVVLGVEAIFARDQHILEEWWRREIDEEEFRRRIRFDLDWGYDWSPFYQLLVTARDQAEAIYGLDCVPRGDMRRAPLHDRHAAEKIAQIRERHPEAVVMVLFGESHLAPSHLPSELEHRLPGEGVLTVLQNVDALYWRVAGESCQQVEGVRVSDDVICVFNSTPLEKYESYRMCLDRWSESESGAPDMTPAVYNLIDGLVRFLNINCYSPHNGTQPKLLADILPEVYCHPSDEVLGRQLGAVENPGLRAEMIQRLEERGSIYVAQTNTLFIREFQLPYAAQEVARFLYHACRGLPENRKACGEHEPLDAAYARVLETALVELAARVLCPFGTSTDAESGEDAAPGLVLGDALYRAYEQGRIGKTVLRRLFLTRLHEPGAALRTYSEAARKVGIAARHCGGGTRPAV